LVGEAAAAQMRTDTGGGAGQGSGVAADRRIAVPDEVLPEGEGLAVEEEADGDSSITTVKFQVS